MSGCDYCSLQIKDGEPVWHHATYKKSTGEQTAFSYHDSCWKIMEVYKAAKRFVVIPFWRFKKRYAAQKRLVLAVVTTETGKE